MGEHQADLEMWIDRLATRLREAGLGVEVAADDRLLGDTIAVLVSMPAASGSGTDAAEIVAVRSRRRHAHVAVLAETHAAAARLADALAAAWRAVGRLANAERKFVHRIERVARHLADEWAGREGGYPREALARLQQAAPDARAMLGCGYHVEIAGEQPEGDGKHRYDRLFGASVPLGGRRRALIFSAARQAFLAPAPVVEALGMRAGAASAIGIAVVGAASLATAAAMLDADAAAMQQQQAQQQQQQQSGGDDGGAVDVLDASSEVCCALPDCLGGVGSWVPDLSSCVPDCGSFDLPDCDCGGLDL